MSSGRTEYSEPLPSVETPSGTGFQVPIQFFQDHVLPPLQQGINPNALIDQGSFRSAVTLQNKLWGYNKKTPSGIHSKDVNKAFFSLQRPVHTVTKAVRDFEPTLVFHNNKHGRSNHEDRTEDTLPDAFFMLESSTLDSVQWTDIAVSGEYQVQNNPDSVQNNITKISQSMATCMRKDPRRRFTYGFTAEDASMKLWYCDRSQIIVSDAFNFVEDWQTLFYFVLAITFAPPHKLGWDPTITAVDGDRETQYEITVRSSNTETATYRTLGVLYDGGARSLLGRGTRVWKAIRTIDGKDTGDAVALKDTWVDGTREREGDIHSQVLESEFLTKKREELRKYLVPVGVHGDVYVRGVRDRTPRFLEPTSASSDMENRSFDTQVLTGISVARFQVHYRIVYEELGEPLSELTSLQMVFRALADAVYGLLAMHQSGWVHRDLSAGNILYVNGVGKITDLEYATNKIREGRSGRAGTANFIAVEVNSGHYLFRQDTKPFVPSPFAKFAIERAMEDPHFDPTPFIPPMLKYQEPDPAQKFHYNPLHDLESLWWLAVYFVINREIDDGEPDESTQVARRRANAQRLAASEFFYQSGKRSSALLETSFFARRLECLPPCIKTVATCLEDIRTDLWMAYTRAEKSVETIDFDVANDVYDHLLVRFQSVMKQLEEKDIKIRRLNVDDGSSM